MKFSDFKSIEDVVQKYPLERIKAQFLPDTEITAPELFMQGLHFSLTMQADVESEMYFRECFIFPFIHQVWMQHPELKLWINRKLAYKDELTGEPDYFISSRLKGITTETVGKPLLAVAEAKQEDFIAGWGQCLAEMIACQKLNDDDSVTIYGIVSTGELWQFGKLEGAIFTRDLAGHTIREPAKLLGALDYVLGECEKQKG